MSEEETREQIEEIINNNEEPVACELRQQSAAEASQEIKEEIKEEVKEEIKPKAKPRASRAKPKVKITKEPVEPVQKIEEPVVEEPIIEEKPKKIDKLKEIVKCPDCNMDMTVHTLKYIHKRRGFCKAEKAPERTASEPEPQAGGSYAPTKITEDIVNDYIKQNPDIVSNYLRNERAMKAQRKQMNARSLLNNAF